MCEEKEKPVPTGFLQWFTAIRNSFTENYPVLVYIVTSLGGIVAFLNRLLNIGTPDALPPPNTTPSNEPSSSRSDSDPVVNLERHLEQIPENAKVGQIRGIHNAEPGNIEALSVLPGPSGSTRVAVVTKEETRGKDTKKLISIPDSGGNDGGKAVGEYVGKSTSSGQTSIGVGPGAIEHANYLQQLAQGMSRVQVPLAPATQSPGPESASSSDSESLTSSSLRRREQRKEGGKKQEDFFPDGKGGAMMTGQVFIEHSQQADVTVVVKTGNCTRDGIVYYNGGNHTGPTNVAMLLGKGPTKSANGIKTEGGDLKLKDAKVLVTDKGNAEKAWEAFEKNPFFDTPKKKKRN